MIQYLLELGRRIGCLLAFEICHAPQVCGYTKFDVSKLVKLCRMKILDGLRRITALHGETSVNLGNLRFLREAVERIFLAQSCGRRFRLLHLPAGREHISRESDRAPSGNRADRRQVLQCTITETKISLHHRKPPPISFGQFLQVLIPPNVLDVLGDLFGASQLALLLSGSYLVQKEAVFPPFPPRPGKLPVAVGSLAESTRNEMGAVVQGFIVGEPRQCLLERLVGFVGPVGAEIGECKTGISPP